MLLSKQSKLLNACLLLMLVTISNGCTNDRSKKDSPDQPNIVFFAFDDLNDLPERMIRMNGITLRAT